MVLLIMDLLSSLKVMAHISKWVLKGALFPTCSLNLCSKCPTFCGQRYLLLMIGLYFLPLTSWLHRYIGLSHTIYDLYLVDLLPCDLLPCRPLNCDVVKQHADVTLDLNCLAALCEGTRTSTLDLRAVETYMGCWHFQFVN